MALVSSHGMHENYTSNEPAQSVEAENPEPFEPSAAQPAAEVLPTPDTPSELIEAAPDATVPEAADPADGSHHPLFDPENFRAVSRDMRKFLSSRRVPPTIVEDVLSETWLSLFALSQGPRYRNAPIDEMRALTFAAILPRRIADSHRDARKELAIPAETTDLELFLPPTLGAEEEYMRQVVPEDLKSLLLKAAMERFGIRPGQQRATALQAVLDDPFISHERMVAIGGSSGIPGARAMRTRILGMLAQVATEVLDLDYVPGQNKRRHITQG